MPSELIEWPQIRPACGDDKKLVTSENRTLVINPVESEHNEEFQRKLVT
jgi:hypothetical protein